MALCTMVEEGNALAALALVQAEQGIVVAVENRQRVRARHPSILSLKKSSQESTKTHEATRTLYALSFVSLRVLRGSISRRRLATPRASGHPRLGRRCPAVRADRSAGRPCYSQCAAAAARATPMRAGVASPA